jgi:hypothetical protein
MTGLERRSLMQQFTQAELLLLRVAREYGANPSLWCPNGWGTMPDGARWELGEDLTPSIAQQLSSVCIDSALIRFGEEYGGEMTAEAARQLIYTEIGGKPERQSIHSYNDAKGRTLDEVIAMLESAAGVRVTTTEKLFERFDIRVAASIIASVGLSALLTLSHVGRMIA